MFCRYSLILIVSYVTAAFTKVTVNRREHVPQQKGLKFEDDSLGLAKPSFESMLINDNIFTENIDVEENKYELASLNDLYKFYDKDNAKYTDSSRDLKRVKRQYNGQVYEDIVTGYSNYPKTLMQKYLPDAMSNYFSHRQGKRLFPEEEPTSGNLHLPAAMPSYFSNRHGKQLAVPEEEPTLGNIYLPAVMPSYFSNRQGKQLAVPEEKPTLGNLYLPAAMPSYFSNRQGNQLIVPEEEPTSGNFYLPAAMPSYFSNRQGKQLTIPEQVFASGNDYLNHPLDYTVHHNIKNAYLSPANHYDSVSKPDENLPLNFQDYPDYVAKPSENVPSVSQDYHDYYAPQENGNPISSDYYDEYMAYQDFLSDYAEDKQLDKDFLADEPIIDLAVEKQDINSQGITQQENSETMDENTQIDSPLEESNIDEDVAYENGDIHFFEEDYIGFTENKPGKKEADETEEDKIEKGDGNKIEYENDESSEKTEYEEETLVKPDKKDDDSEEKSLTRKGGSRVFSIDPEGRISATGLGEEDVKRLIHQVTDIKEGRNLAFMEKFEGLIQKMLN